MEITEKYLMKQFIETNYVTLNRGKYGFANRTTYENEFRIVDEAHVILDLKINERANTKFSYSSDDSVVLENGVTSFYHSVPGLDFRWFTYYKVTTVYEPIYDMDKAQEIVDNNTKISKNC